MLHHVQRKNQRRKRLSLQSAAQQRTVATTTLLHKMKMLADMQHGEAMSADGRDHACVLFPRTSQGSVWLGSSVATIPEKRKVQATVKSWVHLPK